MSSPPANQRPHVALRLVLFAALPALLLSALLIPRPASAEEPTTVWSAALRVGQTISGDPNNFGCNDSADYACTALSDKDFTYDGETYEVESVVVSGYSNALSIDLVQEITPEMRKNLRVIVNGKVYHMDTTRVGASVHWANHGQEWEVGDRVRIKLVERYFPTLTAQPFDHSVDPLTASERTPTRSTEGVAEQYCYTGDGNPGIDRLPTTDNPRPNTTGTTMIRYPDGRTREVPKPNAAIMSMYACN